MKGQARNIFSWRRRNFPADQRVFFIGGGLVYTLLGVTVNLVRANQTACDLSWALYIAAFFVVGVANAVIWPAQQDLVGRCALYRAYCEELSERTAGGLGVRGGDDGGGAREGKAARIKRKVVDYTTHYNSIFFAFYEASGVVGNVVTSCLGLFFAGAQAEGNEILFVLLTLIVVED